jgi:hypothetical protein
MAGKKRAQVLSCKAKGGFREKEDTDDNCISCECEGAPPKCTLYPHNGGCCPEGQEAHHLVPVHCFISPSNRTSKLEDQEKFAGCGKYNHHRAPCICLPEQKHDKMHEKFDAREDRGLGDTKSQAGTWSYDKASSTAAKCVNEMYPDCPEGCIKAQLDSYHKDEAGIKDDTTLRRDSTGKRGNPPRSELAISTSAHFG